MLRTKFTQEFSGCTRIRRDEWRKRRVGGKFAQSLWRTAWITGITHPSSQINPGSHRFAFYGDNQQIVTNGPVDDNSHT